MKQLKQSMIGRSARVSYETRAYGSSYFEQLTFSISVAALLSKVRAKLERVSREFDSLPKAVEPEMTRAVLAQMEKEGIPDTDWEEVSSMQREDLQRLTSRHRLEMDRLEIFCNWLAAEEQSRVVEVTFADAQYLDASSHTYLDEKEVGG